MHESDMGHCHGHNVFNEGVLLVVVVDGQHPDHIGLEVLEKKLIDFAIDTIDHKWQRWRNVVRPDRHSHSPFPFLAASPLSLWFVALTLDIVLLACKARWFALVTSLLPPPAGRTAGL